MPYKHHKVNGKQCVYKADTGEKVGCTKGPVKKYLAALHANVPDAKHESKKLNTMNKSKTTSNIFNPNIIKRIADQVVELQKDTLHEPVWNIDEFMFRNMVMRYVDPAIEKMWLKMNDAQQEQLQQAVERYLGKTDADYRNPKYHEISESKTPVKIKLSEIAKKIMESNKQNIMLNGKEVDMGSIELDGVDRADYPDFSDAYISRAEYVDGTPLNDREIEQLEKENYGLVNDLAHNQIMQENWDWRDDPKISRDFEKSDVSQDEFERSRGYGRYSGGRGRYSGQRTVASPMRITFFNVPAGKESEATKAGLTQFKSGKWGFKHNFDPQVVSVASDREKSAVSDVEKIFGKGRYWEPKN